MTDNRLEYLLNWVKRFTNCREVGCFAVNIFLTFEQKRTLWLEYIMALSRFVKMDSGFFGKSTVVFRESSGDFEITSGDFPENSG
jgi:hypothetical protein